MNKRYSQTLIVLLLFSSILQAQVLNFAPYIPAYKTNPYTATMWNGMQLKNPPITYSYAEFNEIYTAACAYMHPQSPYYMDSTVYTRLTTLLDSFLTNWHDTTNNLVNAAMQKPTCYAYCMLKTLYPNKIPLTRQAIWEDGIKRSIVATVKANTGLFIDKKVGAAWLNGSIDEILGMFYGANAIGDTASQASARYVIEKIFTKCLLKDGGTHYLGYSNEAPTYHPVVVIEFLQYWLVTKSPDVLTMLKGMSHYPVLIEHHVSGSTAGFTEYSTAPADKAYYNAVSQTYPAAVSMWLNNDGYNQNIANGATGYELAFLYDSSMVIKKLPLPNNYMLYDSNSLGPRGRYGPWCVVGATRDNSSALPEHPEEVGYIGQGDGMNTFVGAYILDTVQIGTNKNRVPINAAFQGAGLQVKVAKGVNTDWSRGNTYNMLAIKEHNSITKSNSIYGIGTNYYLSYRGESKTIPWKGFEQWVVTKDRVIGLMEIQNLSQQKVYGMGAHLSLVSGRKGTIGIQKNVVPIDKYTYNYGQLNTRVHDENFHGGITTQQFGIFGGMDSFSTVLNLHDTLDKDKDSLITYPAGTHKYVLWEVTYGNKSYSTANVVATKNTNLVGFQFTEQLGRKTRMIHNLDSFGHFYSDTMHCPFAKASIIQSWNNAVVNLFIATDSSILISDSIPPYGHILVVNSGIDSDHIAGFNTFGTIFKPATVLPVTLLNFSAIAKGNANLINWQIDNEENCSYYEVEKSMDGFHFSTFAKVESGGSTYRLIDSIPFEGTTFYRLIQHEKDGKVKEMGIRVVTRDLPSQNLTVYPNPTHGLITVIATTNFDKGAAIDLTDLSGRTVYHNEILTNNTKTLHIHLPVVIIKGEYLLSIKRGNKKSVTKVMID